MLGQYRISLADMGRIIWSRVAAIEKTWTDQTEAIFLHVRLPRILLAVLVGAGLSVAGACYQGMFRNPLVSSDIIGASSGAAFGAALAILLGMSGAMISVFAFAFSLSAVALVYVISKVVRTNRVLGLVLAGIMVGSVFNAMTSYLKLIADPSNELPAITYWLMGSLNGAKLKQVLYAGLFIVGGIIPLLGLRWKLNLMTMGDREAQTMGISVNTLRSIVIVAATLITAASIAVSGMIGWISLVIPHFARMLVGSDYRRLLPTSVLMGASFLLIVDNVSRLVWSSEIPIGILTSLIGAPFFVILLIRQEGSR